MWRPLTKKYCKAPRRRAFSGRPTNPEIVTIEVLVSMVMSCCSIEREKSAAMRFFSESPGMSLYITLSSLVSENSVVWLTRARRSNSRTMLLSSTCLLLRNLRRAGTLKKMFLIMKLLPSAQRSASWVSQREALMHRRVPISAPRRRVRSST